MNNLDIAKNNYMISDGYLNNNCFYDNYEVGKIWKDNISYHLFHVLTNFDSARDTIQYLNDKAFFDMNCSDPYLSPAIDWKIDFLKNRQGMDIDTLDARFQESDLVMDEVCQSRNGRRISHDFLWRISCYNSMTEHIKMPDKHFNILELGSGFGCYARMNKLFNADNTYFLVDLPESLYFAEVFIREEFPDARIKYLTATDRSEDLTTYDFVFLCPAFIEVVKDLDIFLMINQNSLGEMTNSCMTFWMDQIEHVIQPEYFYSLNRFLNNIAGEFLPIRKKSNACSCIFQPGWEIVDWQVDPDYERSPYFATLFTRNLHAILKTKQASRAPQTGLMDDDLEKLRLQDWNTQPGWINYQLFNGLDSYPPLMSRGKRELNTDFSMNGTLFKLWNHARLNPKDREANYLMAKYLLYLGGQYEPFEEFFYYEKLLMRQVEKQRGMKLRATAHKRNIRRRGFVRC